MKSAIKEGEPKIKDSTKQGVKGKGEHRAYTVKKQTLDQGIFFYLHQSANEISISFHL